MAARRNLPQTKKTREKIQTTQLVKRLTDHALGDVEIMTTSQVNAAKILLNKILPDVKQVEHMGEDGGPIKGEWKVTVSD